MYGTVRHDLPAAITCSAVGASRESNNTIVLGKSRHWSHGHERREDTVQTVCQNSTLDARLVDLSVHLQARNIAGGCNITNGLAGADDEDRQERQDQRSIDCQREGLHPDERANGRRVNTTAIKVATGTGDDTTGQETNDDAGGLHNGRAEALAQEDRDENRESESCSLR